VAWHLRTTLSDCYPIHIFDVWLECVCSGCLHHSSECEGGVSYGSHGLLCVLHVVCHVVCHVVYVCVPISLHHPSAKQTLTRAAAVCSVCAVCGGVVPVQSLSLPCPYLPHCHECEWCECEGMD